MRQGNPISNRRTPLKPSVDQSERRGMLKNGYTFQPEASQVVEPQRAPSRRWIAGSSAQRLPTRFRKRFQEVT